MAKRRVTIVGYVATPQKRVVVQAFDPTMRVGRRRRHFQLRVVGGHVFDRVGKRAIWICRFLI